MQSRDTPTFPYCKNGIIWHNGPSGSHVPWMKRYALNGRTITQNKQSAMHKLCDRRTKTREKQLCGSNIHLIYYKWQNKMLFYLIIKAAATFRTFGHFKRAITVNKFPQMPTIIMMIVAAAAKFSNGRPNLELRSKKKHLKIIKSL